MLPDEKVKCPATGFARSCRSVVSECSCPKFVNVKGRDPQSGEVFDRYGCADAFLPMLLVEVAQQSRQAGAAVESFRNEIVKANEEEMQRRQEVLHRLGYAGNAGLVG